MQNDNRTAQPICRHICFFQTLDLTQKKQKSQQANAQGQCTLDTTDLRPKRSPAELVEFV
jgi:hypothetical protein